MRAMRVLLIVGLMSLLAAGAYAGTTERVSVDSAGNQGNANSGNLSSISADGRYVAFGSAASNLVPNDTNGVSDVFVHDRITGTTERISVDSAGIQGNNVCDGPSISADGRYVAFQSSATNLVPNDTNGVSDIFVRDILAGTTERISIDSAGNQGNGNSYSGPSSISADGRYVTFQSLANNLVSNDTNGVNDVYVRDRVSGATERVSVDSAGIQGNNGSISSSISADGRYIAFQSSATNLITNDTNGVYDIFVRDRVVGITERVSVDSAGNQADCGIFGAGISAYGRYVVFGSCATNLVSGVTSGENHAYVRDRVSGITEIVDVDNAGTPGNAFTLSYFYTISANGRYVAFPSVASNLVSGDNEYTADVFVRDRAMHTTQRVSIDSSGIQGNNSSVSPAISADGRYVAFRSVATNLVSNDTNGRADIFVHDTLGGCQ